LVNGAVGIGIIAYVGTVGVWGQRTDTDGTGVHGYGAEFGVEGQTNDGGTGVFGDNGSTGIGVEGQVSGVGPFRGTDGTTTTLLSNLYPATCEPESIGSMPADPKPVSRLSLNWRMPR
jgi:hypothetical protein